MKYSIKIDEENIPKWKQEIIIGNRSIHSNLKYFNKYFNNF